MKKAYGPKGFRTDETSACIRTWRTMDIGVLWSVGRRPNTDSANHVSIEECIQLVWPLDESKGPSQLHGHGHGLVCEVALRIVLSVTNSICLPQW